MDRLDAYKNAVLQQLPPGDRPEVGRELQSLLYESFEGRLEAQPGADPESIQLSVLRDFGSPRDYAAQYLTRTPSLIGPSLLPGFIRTVAITIGVFWVVISLAMFSALTEASWNDLMRVLRAFAEDLITGSLALLGTVTLIFAVVERFGRHESGTRESGTDEGDWDPHTLPVLSEFEMIGRSWYIFSLMFLALIFSYTCIFPGFLGGSFVSVEEATYFVPLLGAAVRDSMWAFSVLLVIDLIFTVGMMFIQVWAPWSRLIDSVIGIGWLVAIAQPLFRGRLTVDESWLLANGWSTDNAVWYADFLISSHEGKMRIGLLIIAGAVLVILGRMIIKHFQNENR